MEWASACAILPAMEQHRPAKMPEGLRRLYYIKGQDHAEDRLVYRRATEDIIATSRESLTRSRRILKRLGGPPEPTCPDA
jgi:hypothetical protein